MDKIDSLKQLQNIIHKKNLKVLYFTASWCGPCKRIYPLVIEIINKLPIEMKDKFFLYKIDIDNNDEITTKYKINKVPTFILIDHNGKEIYKFTGANIDNFKTLLKKGLEICLNK